MTMNLEEIRALIQDLENSSLREFELSDGDFSLHLSKNENAALPAAVAPAPAANSIAPEVQEASAPAVEPFKKAAKPELTINAPLVGTVYLRPNPDAPAFKSVGDRVVAGEQVAIVEAMKLMTPVKSEIAGVITEILVEEDQVVEFDMPMFRVDPKG